MGAWRCRPDGRFLFLVLLLAHNKRERSAFVLVLEGRGKGVQGFPTWKRPPEVALAAASLGTVGDGMGMVGW